MRKLQYQMVENLILNDIGPLMCYINEDGVVYYTTSHTEHQSEGYPSNHLN